MVESESGFGVTLLSQDKGGFSGAKFTCHQYQPCLTSSCALLFFFTEHTHLLCKLSLPFNPLTSSVKE